MALTSLNYDDQANLYVALFGAFSILIDDKIGQVAVQCMNSIGVLMNVFPPPPVANNSFFRR